MALDPITGGEQLLDDALNKFIPDPVAAAQAKAQLLQIAQQSALAQMQAQSSVIQAEMATHSWLADNWRPLVMMMFALMIFNNYAIAPYLQAWYHWSVVLVIPDGAWSLLKIGIGGYIFCRTGEKMVDAGAAQSAAAKVSSVASSVVNTFKGH